MPVSKVVDVKDQPSNLDLTVPIHTLAGRILWEDGSPFSDSVLNQVAVSTTSNPNFVATTIFTLSSGGVFSGALESNEYRFYVRNLPDGYQIKSVSSGKADLMKEPFQFDINQPMDDVVVRVAEISYAEGKVIGKVVDAVTGKPSSAERVQLCCLNTGPVERRSTALRSDGSFEFSGVPAGRYTAELKGKTAIGIANPTVDVGSAGNPGLTLVSASQFVTVAMSISVDGNITPRPDLAVSMTLTSATSPNGEPFRMTVSGAIGSIVTSVPMGLSYAVSVSSVPAGFKVKSIAPDPLITTVGSLIRIDLTRSE